MRPTRLLTLPRRALPNLSVAKRLSLGFGLVMALSVATTTVAVFELLRVAASIDHVAALNAEYVAHSRAMQDAVTQAYISATTAARANVKDDLRFYLTATKDRLAEYDRLKTEFDKISDNGKKAPPQMRESLAHVKEGEGSVRPVLGVLLGDLESRLSNASGEELQASSSIESSMNEMKDSIDFWLKGLQQAAQGAMQASEEASGEAKAAAQLARNVLVGATALSALFSGIAATLIARSVTRPIRQAVNVAERVATGDLSEGIQHTRRDETGVLLDALGRMQDGLHEVVAEVRQSVEMIEGASSEMASGNADLSRRTEETAGELQGTVSSMGELTETVQRSTQAAQSANERAGSATAAAQRGGRIVTRVVQNMADIAASSRRVTEITAAIEGIAFQTNILALNAAVEAARAGEGGRGFAVVAGEVRTLAQRASAAAKDIKSLIAVSVEQVETGSQLVRDAGKSMDEIVSSVEQVTAMIQDITTASAAQSDGIGQVGSAVMRLERMTQQNAALVEQSAAASQSLKAQANRLTKLVSAFRLTEQQHPAEAREAEHPEVSVCVA